MWVNLSPYEENKIISKTLGQTEMGRDMLAQDYLLKQLSASLVYPEESLGRAFWKRVHQKAYELYGTTDLPYNTFNKVWIVPAKAVVFESAIMPEKNEEGRSGVNAVVVNQRLKVMMEEDYVAMANQRAMAESRAPAKGLAMRKNMDRGDRDNQSIAGEDVAKINTMTSEAFRKVVLPEIEKEINQGESFAQLRQIYNSLILAVWYKTNLKESILNQAYADQGLTAGVDVQDKKIVEKIYGQYMDAIHKGVFDYIKEDYDATLDAVIPRQYFSGGIPWDEVSRILKNKKAIGDLDQGERTSLLQDIGRVLSVRAQMAGETATAQEADDWQNAGPDQFIKLAWERDIVRRVTWEEFRESESGKNFLALMEDLTAAGLKGAEHLFNLLVALLPHKGKELDDGAPGIFVISRQGATQLAEEMGIENPEEFTLHHFSKRGFHGVEDKMATDQEFSRLIGHLIHELVPGASLGKLDHPYSVALELITRSGFRPTKAETPGQVNAQLTKWVAQHPELVTNFKTELNASGFSSWNKPLVRTFMEIFGSGKIGAEWTPEAFEAAKQEALKKNGRNTRDVAAVTALQEKSSDTELLTLTRYPYVNEAVYGFWKEVDRNGWSPVLKDPRLLNWLAKKAEPIWVDETVRVLRKIGQAMSEGRFREDAELMDAVYAQSEYANIWDTLASLMSLESMIKQEKLQSKITIANILRVVKNHLDFPQDLSDMLNNIALAVSQGQLRDGAHILEFVEGEEPGREALKDTRDTQGWVKNKKSYLGVLSEQDLLALIEKHADKGEAFSGKVQRNYLNMHEYVTMKHGLPAIDEIYSIDTGGEFFGVTVIDGIGYIEKAYLNRINRLGNWDQLNRAFIYALTPGTHGDKKEAEAQYVRENFDKDAILDHIKFDPIAMLKKIMADHFPATVRDNRMYHITRKRYSEYMAEIMINRLNRSPIDKKGSRMLLNDKEFAEGFEGDGRDGADDVRVCFLNSASNPLHDGHFETFWRALAYLDLDYFILAPDGKYRPKAVTYKTEAERHEMADSYLVEYFGDLIKYSSFDLGKDVRGEDAAMGIFTNNLEKGRKGKVTMYYLHGSDHMHWLFPDGKSKNESGVRTKPDWNDPGGSLVSAEKASWDFGQGETEVRPDVVWMVYDRLEEYEKESGGKIAQSGWRMPLLFNHREWADGVELEEEKDQLAKLRAEGFYAELPGVNLPGTSSTDVREVLSGEKALRAATYLPRSIYNKIMRYGTYRGWNTFVVPSFRALSDEMEKNGTLSAESKDYARVQRWLEVQAMYGKSVTAEDFFNTFFRGYYYDQVDESGQVSLAHERKTYVTLENTKKVFEALAAIKLKQKIKIQEQSFVPPGVDKDIHKGKTVFITGGSGYIAMSVIKALLDNGSNVIIYDNNIRGMEIFDDQEFKGRVTIIQGDLGDLDALDQAMTQGERVYGQIDHVLHLADLIENGPSMRQSGLYIDNNIRKTFILMSAMREHRIMKMAFASSAGIYGSIPGVIHPDGVYGETKWVKEKIFKSYAEALGLTFVANRFYNVAGAFEWKGRWHGEKHDPSAPETHLIPLTIQTAQGFYPERKIFGNDYDTRDGTAIRDYIHVTDLARGIVKSIAWTYVSKQNLTTDWGTGNGTSVKEIVDTVKRLSGKDFKVMYTPRRPGDAPVLLVPPEKLLEAKQILGWEAVKTNEDIISDAWQYHEQDDVKATVETDPPKENPQETEPEHLKNILKGVQDEKIIPLSLRFEILYRTFIDSLRDPAKAQEEQSIIYKEGRDWLAKGEKVIETMRTNPTFMAELNALDRYPLPLGERGQALESIRAQMNEYLREYRATLNRFEELRKDIKDAYNRGLKDLAKKETETKRQAFAKKGQTFTADDALTPSRLMAHYRKKPDPAHPEKDELQQAVQAVFADDDINMSDPFETELLAQQISELESADTEYLAGLGSSPGGIDFNPDLLNLEILRDENGQLLPFSQQPIFKMDINGLVPVIIRITPVTSLPLLLGLEGSSFPEDGESIYGELSPVDKPQHSYALEPEGSLI